MRIPLSKPYIGDAEKNSVREVMDSGHISLGPQTVAFEKALAEHAGRREAVAVSSGTAGLHLALIAAGVGDGDEVITSPFSFIAPSNAILYVGARIVFADILEDSLCIDPAGVAETVSDKTRAILPVHVFGAVSDMGAITGIARDRNLKIIEDACEALGANNVKSAAGGKGDFAVFAFYPNKQITTGEGGAIVTDDVEAAELLRSLRNQGRGKSGGAIEHVRLGYNYRMHELSAAIGRVQLEKLDAILELRVKVAARYNECLKGIDDISLLGQSPGGVRSWFVYVIFLREPGRRAALQNHLFEHGIENRIYFPPLHLFRHIREHGGFREGQFPVTERVAASALALPFFTEMKDEEVYYVCEKVAAFFA